MTVPGSTPYVNSLGQTVSFVQNVTNNNYAISSEATDFSDFKAKLIDELSPLYDPSNLTYTGKAQIAVPPTMYNNLHLQALGATVTPVYYDEQREVGVDSANGFVRATVPPIIAYYLVDLPYSKTVDAATVGLPPTPEVALDNFFKTLPNAPITIDQLYTDFETYFNSLRTQIMSYTPSTVSLNPNGPSDVTSVFGHQILQFLQNSNGAGSDNFTASKDLYFLLQNTTTNNGGFFTVNGPGGSFFDTDVISTGTIKSPTVYKFDPNGGAPIVILSAGTSYPLLFDKNHPGVYPVGQSAGGTIVSLATGGGSQLIPGSSPGSFANEILVKDTKSAPILGSGDRTYFINNGNTFPEGTAFRIAVGRTLERNYQLALNQNFGYSNLTDPTGNPTGDFAGITTFKSFDESVSWVNAFLASINPLLYTSPSSGNANALLSAMSTSLTTTALLQNQTVAKLQADVNSMITDPADLLRYEAIYKALFPRNSLPQFQSFLTTFHDSQVTKNGYFNPSYAFPDFIQSVETTFNASLASNAVRDTFLKPMDADKVLIILNLYKLISTFLNTIQSVAQAQANRLIKLSSWQKAYTYLLAQVPVIKSSQISDTTQRSEINTGANANYRTNIQTYQSLVADDIKTLQSNVNQSNDAMSQQTNYCTSLIQEMSTLLSAIYR